ncbi:MFS transporter [Subtercola lobariae]|uniref:MFS transporter n=1 Tax=Subtercola lobariae TaxID=1588641 RepID=A0A917B9D3_9MICO|nr:MFS transporter [Subtercola lobariae]GGF30471.1 MFS transporter [Subtercola lobariae]
MTLDNTEVAIDSEQLGTQTIEGAIDAMPRLGISIGAIGALFVTFFLGTYESAVLALALPSVSQGLNVAQTDLALAVSLNLLGGAIGAYVIGYFADRFGRQMGLRLMFLLFGVGSLATALAWNVESLTVFRVLSGLGMGAVLPLLAGYLGEMAPKARRGRAIAGMGLVGTLLVAIASFASIPLLAASPAGAWRILLGLGAVSLVLLPLINRRDITESPRWLGEHGKLDDAGRIVRRMEARARGEVTPSSIRFIETPKTLGLEIQKPLKALLTTKLMRNRLIMIVVVLFLFFAGFTAMNTYTPLFLEGAGMSSDQALLITALTKSAVVVSSVVIIFLIERIERRTLIICSILLVVLSVALMICGLGIAAATVGAFLLGFATGAMSAPLFTYIAEIFATNVRGTAASIADGIGALGGATAPLVILPLLVTVSSLAAGVVVIVIMLVACVVLFLGVRTNGRSLEDISAE